MNIKKTLKEMYSNKIEESKSPKTADPYLGIEIEFMSKYPMTGLQLVVNQAGLGKHVSMGTDGSIEDENYSVSDDEYWDEYTDFYAIEARILVKQSEVKRVLNKFQEILDGCGARINKTCGLHVHIDMRNRDVLQVSKRFLSIQDTLYSMVPYHRRNNNFCLKESATITKEMIERGGTSKYRGINVGSYASKKTIEIRVHHGTKNMTEVVDWCKFLVHVADTSTGEWSPWWHKYVSERVNKYA